MLKHRTDLTRGTPLPSTWVNALMEFVGGGVSANFAVELVPATPIVTVRIPAGTGNDQVSIGIGGKWRFVTANVTAVHPGGAAGVYDAFVTASENDLSAVDPADATDYTFGLTVRARSGGLPNPPTATGATAYSRRVAEVYWSGTAIVGIKPLVGVGAGARLGRYAHVDTTESTSATGPVVLATAGPMVALDVPTDSLVEVYATASTGGNGTGSARVWVDVSTLGGAALTQQSLITTGTTASTQTWGTVPGSAGQVVGGTPGAGWVGLTGLSAGVLLFQLKYGSTSGAVNFAFRRLAVRVVPALA